MRRGVSVHQKQMRECRVPVIAASGRASVLLRPGFFAGCKDFWDIKPPAAIFQRTAQRTTGSGLNSAELSALRFPLVAAEGRPVFGTQMRVVFHLKWHIR
jgi:hypothetical protein